MTTPAPAWLPDPTGRHEYRYWDGATWSSDVSDAGVTSVDALPAPVPAPGAAAAAPIAPGDDPTQVIDGTGSYGPPTAAYGAPPVGGPPPAGGYPPGPGTGGYPPPARHRSGPSTGLLVGLAALAVALIAGIAFVLASGDDGGDDGDTATGATTTTTADDDVATTEPPDEDGGDLGIGDGSDIDIDDPDTREAVVEAVAGQLEAQGLDREQAECLANGVLDGLSTERLAEIGESGGDISSLTPEEMTSVFSAVLDCGVTDFPGAGAPGSGGT